LTNRIFFPLLIGSLFVAGTGLYLLNELFLSAYRVPGRVPATAYAIEMAQHLEALQDIFATGEGEEREVARRLRERYQTRAAAFAPFLAPLLNSRISGYHASLGPLMDRWAGGAMRTETERAQVRGDLAALRKIIILAGQRLERETTEERRADALFLARATAALFCLLFLAALVLLVIQRQRARRTPNDAAPPVDAGSDTGVGAVKHEETARELAREQVLVKRYREMLDSLPAAVAAADAVSGQVLFANAAFRSWFGLADDLIGEPVSVVAARTGVAFAEQGKMTFEGKTYWRDTVRAGETEIYLLRDISEQERLATRLVNSERLISIGEMASKVTHEIRNPLSTVKMNAEYIADHAGTLTPEELAAAIDRIVREVARLEEITDRYMGMVRYRAEEEAAPHTELPSALEDIVRFHAGEFSRRAIVLEIGPLPKAESPLSLNSFREVMLNLLKNAWEELGTGGTVRVRGEADPQTVRIVIEDSGRGVPPAERGKIFRNFSTPKPGGTGSGLSHSLKLVAEVGGTITVDDSPLGGARFSVMLPRSDRSSQG